MRLEPVSGEGANRSEPATKEATSRERCDEASTRGVGGESGAPRGEAAARRGVASWSSDNGFPSGDGAGAVALDTAAAESRDLASSDPCDEDASAPTSERSVCACKSSRNCRCTRRSRS
jgi:hypothetical protein